MGSTLGPLPCVGIFRMGMQVPAEPWFVVCLHARSGWTKTMTPAAPMRSATSWASEARDPAARRFQRGMDRDPPN